MKEQIPAIAGPKTVVSIDSIQPDPANARRHNARNLEIITNSLKRFGQVEPLVVQKSTRIVIGGNGRLEVMKELGWAEVEIVEVDLDSSEATRLALILNRSSELAEWDEDNLSKVLSALQRDVDFTEGLKDLSTLGWDAVDLKALIEAHNENGAKPAPEPKIDKAAELQKKWNTGLGQRWIVGRHTVTCGDARELEEACDGVCTDPPFDMTASEVGSVMSRYSNRAVVLSSDLLAFGLAMTWKFRLDMIWRHRKPKFTRATAARNAPIFYHNHILFLTRDEKVKLGWIRPAADFGSVIETEREYEDTEFELGKATELFVVMLSGFKWKTVADPFLGAGGVLLACEETDRDCYAVEINPNTLAVALERFENAGLSPYLDSTVR